MKTRFQVGDIINYNTPDKSFSYANGDYEVLETSIEHFSDNDEEFQSLRCRRVGDKLDEGFDCFCDGSVTPNPYLSKVK